MTDRQKVLENVAAPLDGSEKIVDANGANYHGVVMMGVTEAGAKIPIFVGDDGKLYIDAVFSAGDIKLGAIELQDAEGDGRASVEKANTPRSASTIVLAVQHVDAEGNPAVFPASLGSKADAASLAVTQSTEDKAVLAAMSGKLPASLGVKGASASLSVAQSTEDAAKVPGLGVAASSASRPVVLASDDAHLGEVGADADVDGNIHGQLRSIGNAAELIDNTIAATGATAATSSNLSGGIYETYRTEVTTGQQRGIAIGPFGGVIGETDDLTQGVTKTQDSTALSGVPFQPAAQTTLTAPGDGNESDVNGWLYHTVAVTVVLNSCTNVIVRVDGTLNTSYGTASLSSTAVAGAAYAANLVTITVDGTYLLTLKGPYKKIKPVFQAENGDTDSTVTFQVRSSN